MLLQKIESYKRCRKRKCKKGLFARQKLLSKSIASANDTSALMATSTLLTELFTFFYSPSAVGALGASMDRGGNREVAQKNKFIISSMLYSIPVPGASLGTLEVCRNTPGCP